MAKKAAVKSSPKCAVCKAEINDKIAKYVTDYEGQRYYFCSGNCMREFSGGPDTYVYD